MFDYDPCAASVFFKELSSVKRGTDLEVPFENFL
jgi:hypothetical protein